MIYSHVYMVTIAMVTMMIPWQLDATVIRRSPPDDAGVDLGGFFVNFFQNADLRDTCLMSDWSDWSSPESMTHCSDIVRTRTVLRSADFCPALTETKTECPTYLSAAEALNTGFFGRVMDVARSSSQSVASGAAGPSGAARGSGHLSAGSPNIFIFADVDVASADVDVGVDSVSPTAIDVLYIVDKSGSVGEDFFRMALNDVKRLVEIFPLPISSSESRVALMTFSSEDRINIEFNFEQNEGIDDIVGAIAEVPYEDGMTCTATALRMALSDLFDAPGARETLHKYLFMLTDGHSNCGGNAVDAANLVKNAHVEIFALGITDDINEVEIKQIVSSPVSDHFFYVESYYALTGMVDVLSAFNSMGRLGAPSSAWTDGEQIVVSGPDPDDIGTNVQFGSWLHQDASISDPGPLGEGQFTWGAIGSYFAK